MNIGTFLYTTSKALMNLGTKLYEAFTMEVSLGWLTKLLNTLGVQNELPEYISMGYILVSASAVLLVVMIFYNIFK